jgi:hypothetical protein
MRAIPSPNRKSEIGNCKWGGGAAKLSKPTKRTPAAPNLSVG